MAKRSIDFEARRRFMPNVLALLLAFSFWPSADAAPSTYVPSSLQPPSLRREFRGVWVATVGNIDWPSQPGLPAPQQKAELIAILERAVHLRLNAVILQIRPSCDAFYATRLEPWSEYLSGQMGVPPQPAYDPLAFAVEEAHRRGLELHAWFNPYRARTPNARSPISPNHISKVSPELVKSYNGYLWLDPGEKKVQEHILKVFLDVTRRYDIDAVHIDDYFYPPQERNASGKVVPFPDGPSWKGYLDAGGKLDRDDWRRANVNGLIDRLYKAIKAEKPWVKFGVSPSGIWRPGHPPQIRGFDPYAQIYADSRKWFAHGWLDYFAPQLYWDIGAPAQSYPVLLKWWAEQNTLHRHLWPGNAVSRLGPNRPASEIVNQIRCTRQQRGASGNILWNCRPLMLNKVNIVEALRAELYTQPVLVPASTWLDNLPPTKPKLYAGRDVASNIRLSWEKAGAEEVWLWLLQTKVGANWTLDILPGRENGQVLAAKPAPLAIALTAVDRCGNASTPIVLEHRPAP